MIRNRSDRTGRRRELGLTLVELMIALALSLLLAAGAFTIFTATKRASVTQQDLARMQENLRFAITEMIDRATLAGYMGCVRSMADGQANITSTVAVRDIDSDERWAPDLTQPISGVEGAGGAPDSLTLIYANPLYPARVSIAAPPVGGFSVVRDVNYARQRALLHVQQGSTLVAADCEHATVFRLSNTPPGGTGADDEAVPFALSTGSTLNMTMDKQHVFGRDGEPAWIRKLEVARFFIDQKTIDGKQVRALMMRRLGQRKNQADELVRGVEDLQVEYGIDDAPYDGSADRYMAWSSAVPALRIASLRIRLTVNGGDPVAAADGRVDPAKNVKRDIQFTIKLRNQVGEFL